MKMSDKSADTLIRAEHLPAGDTIARQSKQDDRHRMQQRQGSNVSLQPLPQTHLMLTSLQIL